MSHMWTSHVTHVNEPCHTSERVMSHIWMSNVTHMNESCHTDDWVMSHIRYKSCHTYEWITCAWGMSPVSHVTHINESSQMWLPPKYCSPWLIPCVTWFIHTCDMPRAHVCHAYIWHVTHMNAFICSYVSHSYVFICSYVHMCHI